MLKNVIQYINKLSVDKLDTEYSKTEIAEALTSLMRQMVLADGVVRDEEVDACVKLLREHHSDIISDETEPHLIKQLKEGGAESIFPLITILKSKLSKPQIEEIKQQLISIANSDKEYHEMEKHFVQLVNELS